MYKHETFPHAPITEALIDVRVTSGGAQLADLDRLAEQFADRYPIKQPRVEHEYQVKLSAAGASAETHATSTTLGYVRFTPERERAIQLRINGFAFSKMKPYESWSSLRDEAREHWEVYRAAVKPSRVVRLAVRFINRIEIPLPIEQFEDYILTGPRLADAIPQGLSEFFFRAVVPNPEVDQMQAAISSTFERPKPDVNVLPYIFDIDAFIPVDFYPSDTDRIWGMFEILRDYKNLIFFNSVTEKTKDLFR